MYKITAGQSRCTTELHHLTLKGLIREHGKTSKGQFDDDDNDDDQFVCLLLNKIIG